MFTLIIPGSIAPNADSVARPVKSRVHASLLLSGELSQGRVDIKAQDGEVSVSGTIPDWVSDEQIVDKIKKLPGVKRVSCDLTTLSPSLGLGD